jgi:hypothetical protein
MPELVDVAELDCIYLSYDEPQAEEFWAIISAEVPWAKHVHGVKGSDAAHKAAADSSDTSRFILIDGDNLPNWAFFNQVLKINSENENAVFRWRAQNHINGLRYGNGGLSCWTKDFIYNMKTHENSDGADENNVEFCFDPSYWPMHDTWSTTYPNGSAKHAWRAGFREGVKMCLDRGTKPTLAEFEQRVHASNLNNLVVWQTVGADAQHGNWAIYGARLGTYLTMLTGWDHTLVQDFDALEHLWEKHSNDMLEIESKNIGAELTRRLSLPIIDMDAQSSKFFKDYQRTRPNLDIMLREGFERKFLKENEWSGN